jgi:hypothetical protein
MNDRRRRVGSFFDLIRDPMIRQRLNCIVDIIYSKQSVDYYYYYIYRIYINEPIKRITFHFPLSNNNNNNNKNKKESAIP